MKKSVWYHKLWNDKLNKVPIKKSSNAAWEGMAEILDKNLPKSQGITDSTASFGKKILKIVAYVTPIVVIIAVVLFFSEPKRNTSPTPNAEMTVSVLDSNDNYLEIPGEAIEQLVVEDTIPLFRPMNNIDKSIGRKSIKTKSEILLDRNVVITTSNSILAKEESIDLYKGGGGALISENDSSEILHVTGITGNKGYEPSKVIDKKVDRKRRRKSRDWGDFTLVPYSYGVDVGTNLGREGANLSVGFFGDFALNDNWLINLGVQINSKQNIQGEFSHPSFFRPDSSRYSFKVKDARKLIVLDVPVKLEYKLSELISLNTGVIVNFPISQSSILTQLGPVVDIRDTLFYGKEISSALASTEVNRINFGFSSGFNVHFKRFDLRGSYQVLTPYRIHNMLGSFNHKNRYFRLGIGYRFK